jgi:hypothetical protein
LCQGVFVVFFVQSKSISHIAITYVIELGVFHVKKRIEYHCPCGYVFEAFCTENEAVALVKSHVDRFHKDLLPFGITHIEAKALLKIEYENKPKAPKEIFYHAPTEPSADLKKTIAENQRAKREKIKMCLENEV